MQVRLHAVLLASLATLFLAACGQHGGDEYGSSEAAQETRMAEATPGETGPGTTTNFEQAAPADTESPGQ